MANNYVQSCVSVTLGSNEAAKEALALYQSAQKYIDNYNEEDVEPPSLKNPGLEEWEKIPGLEEWEAFLEVAIENEVISFECYVQGKEIYIGSEECADPEHMAYFIQFIQKYYNLNEPILITWAETCSKLREGEFNGGCAIVHKDLIQFRKSSYEWFIDVCKENNIERNIP